MSPQFRICTGKFVAITVALIGCGSAPAQTWIGATGDWNTPSNWTPAVVPNSAAAGALFTGAGLTSINISSSVQAQSLVFFNATGNYTLTSSPVQTLSGVTGIVVNSNVTSGTRTINLGNVSGGSLLIAANSDLTITNLSTSTSTTLVIGPSTVIGANPGNSGVNVDGPGTTQISGSFSGGVTQVTSGLSKTGTGRLIFSGSGASLIGGLSVTGGTLELNYATNTASKLGGGGLTLGGGVLSLVANTVTAVTQNIVTPSGTTILAGQTDIIGSSAGGGTFTLNAVTFIRNTVGGTMDVSTGSGAPTFSVTASNGLTLTNNLLVNGGFATFGGGATWASGSGTTVTGLASGSYSVNTFALHSNVDVTSSQSPATFNVNSLRFNSGGFVTLTLTGTNTLESGGILVTPTSALTKTITGGTITSSHGSGDELLIHQYGGGLVIDSALISADGLTKTGTGLLTLGGTNTGLTGAINVNRGNLRITTTAAVNSASQISFNDNRGGVSAQQFIVDLGNDVVDTVSPPVRLAPTGTTFTTNSIDSRVRLTGVVSSPSGFTTPVRFDGGAGDSSGYNLLNSGNTFTGDVTLVHGFLGINADGSLGNASNTLNLQINNDTGGGLEFLGPNITVARPIVVGFTTRVLVNGTDSDFLSGTLSSNAGAFKLVKAGSGTLFISGNGGSLLGGMTLSGGNLRWDYTTNTNVKQGGGGLTLNGGVLTLVANLATPVTQLTGGTTVNTGHTDIQLTSSGGGTITLGLGTVGRTAFGTVDFSAQGVSTFTVTTTTGNTVGLFGSGPAFATFNNGATWATDSGGNVIAFTGYDTNNFATTSNTDVTQSANVGAGGITINSLRFNTGSPTLTLNGTLTVNSGGILVTSGNVGGSITGGGTLTAGGSGELIVHQYDSAAFPINAPIVASAGLTKTGTGNLILGVADPGLTGPVNVSRGGLTVKVTDAVNASTAINFNETRGGSSQSYSVDLGNNTNGQISPPIRLSATGSSGTTFTSGTQFNTGTSLNSRVTLAGVISSAAGLITPIQFSAIATDTSGFNLTNAGNSFSGNVNVAHGFLGISADGSLGDPANRLVLNQGTTTTGGLEFLNTGVTVARPVSILSPTRIISNGTDSNTISGVISGGGVQFNKAGTGTLTLTNGSNTFGGSNVTIGVDSGTLSLGTAGVVGGGTNLIVNANATFAAATAPTSTLYGNVSLNGGTLRAAGVGQTVEVNQVTTNSAGGTVDFSAATGATVLELFTATGITIAGNATWLGPTGGTGRISGGNSADAPITISPGVTFTNGLALATHSFGGYSVTGGGTLFQNADVASAASANAPLTIAGGRFRVTDASSNGGVGNFGTGTFTLDGGTFAYGGAIAATSKAIALTANGATIDIETAATTLTANGAITGPGPLTKIGPGTLVLGNAGNSFSALTISAGTLQTAIDAALGTAPTIPVAGLGTLQFAGTPTTARTFNLNFGTLAAAGGATATLNGAAVVGGFMRGPGTFALTGGAVLSGVTVQSSAVLNQTGPASYVNVSQGGQLGIGPGINVSMSALTNQGSGAITVGALDSVGVSDFQSYGTLTITPATVTENFSQTTLMTNVGTSQLFFNGGSRTFIGTPQSAVFPVGSPQAGQPTFVAGIDCSGKNAVIAGGLFVNNGYVIDSTNGFSGTATVVADFGSLVKGAGFFQNTVQTINGGKFQAGNSPGAVSFGTFVLGPGGVNSYVFAIDDGTGTAGPSPDAAGHVSGWGLVKAIGRDTSRGDFTWTATPADKLFVSLQTLLNPTTVGVDLPGPMDHFDPTRSYVWPAVEWAGSYAGPADNVSLDASTAFDLTGFANPTDGRFGWAFDAGGHTLSLTYTPSAVPEPGALTLLALAAFPLLRGVSRRRVVHPSPR
jgi:autotransporter-associated beta strand protein